MGIWYSSPGHLRSPQRLRVVLGAPALFLLLTGAPAVSAPAQVPGRLPAGGETALRTRVGEFYNLLQAKKWSQAEKYVTRASVETYRNQQKTPFLGFQIDSIKLSPDGQSAEVVVRVQVMTAYSPTPFPLRRPSTWRRVDGVWLLVASDPPANALQSEFQQMPMAAGAAHPSSRPAELKFESLEVIVDPIHAGETKEARFSFTNVSSHVVRLGEVKTGSDRLRLKGEKKEYKPGESGTLVFDWDPVHYDYGYALANTIIVETQPGGAVTLLNARTFVTPLPSAQSSSQDQRQK